MNKLQSFQEFLQTKVLKILHVIPFCACVTLYSIVFQYFAAIAAEN